MNIRRFITQHGWFLITGILFAISWYLIRTIIITNYTSPPVLAVGFQAKAPVVRKVSLVKTDRGVSVEISTVENIVTESALTISGLRDKYSCVQHWHYDTALQKSMPPVVDVMLTGTKLDAYQYTAAGPVKIESDDAPYLVKMPGGMHASTTTCKLSIVPLAVTYSTRKITIHAGWSGYPFIIDFSRLSGVEGLQLAKLAGPENIESLQGVPIPSDVERVLQPGDILEVSWAETDRLESRDLMLIVIGTLLGLATGTFLEWLRPFITGGEN